MNLTKEEKQEKETLKKQLYDSTCSVLTNAQYPLLVSRYNYLVMKEINAQLTPIK